jgi:hypothetical protein
MGRPNPILSILYVYSKGHSYKCHGYYGTG